jgi:tetratricopeptide (TPR) repeat protein
MAARAGRVPEAETHFAAAIALEDALTYDEPPPWYYPVRQSLGAALLAARRPREAEAVYREDLRRYPENGWSLAGLRESLRAQGRTAEADSADARFRRAWTRADVPITGATR